MKVLEKADDRKRIRFHFLSVKRKKSLWFSAIPAVKKRIDAKRLTTPRYLQGGDRHWARILLIVGLLLAWAPGCGKNFKQQINASFKSGGTILQVTNTGNWEWLDPTIKINRYESFGPFTLKISKLLKPGQSVNLTLSSFKNKFGVSYDPSKSEVVTVSLHVVGEERTFRFK